MAKKHKIAIFLTILTSFLAIENEGFLVRNKTNIELNSSQLKSEGEGDENPEDEPSLPDFQIKVLDLKSSKGDCSIIRYKDQVIMIDAGGETSEAPSIIYDEIKDLDKIDYLIFTHADKDHIFSFTNENGIAKWLKEKENRVIENFIDFDVNIDSKKKLIGTDDNEENKSTLVQKYCALRNKLIENGKKGETKEGQILNYYNSLDCSLDQNGAKSFFNFEGSESDGIRILYNYFYDHDGDGLSESALKNTISTSVLIEVDGHKHLFAGDLEEFESQNAPNNRDEETDAKPYKRIYGESFLLAANYEYLKDGVDFYKASHHGANTSNSTFFMDAIRPKYIGIPCAAYSGTTPDSTKFPRTLALMNMTKWTDLVYINGRNIVNDEGEDERVPFYGDILLNYDLETGETEFTSTELLNGGVEAKESLFETNWFIDYDNFCQTNIYTLGNEDDTGDGLYAADLGYVNPPIEPEPEDEDDKAELYYKWIQFVENAKPQLRENIHNRESLYPKYDADKNSNATYIKVGHIDILVNFGEVSSKGYMPDPIYNNVKKVCNLCNDHVLDYLIISNNNVEENISDLLGNKGLLKAGNLNAINNLCMFGTENMNLEPSALKQISKLLNDKLIKGKTKLLTSDDLSGQTITLFNNEERDFEINLDFLNLPQTQSTLTEPADDIREHSLAFTFNSRIADLKYTYANLGPIMEPLVGETLYSLNETKLEDIDTYDLMSHGRIADDIDGMYSFYKKLNRPVFLNNGIKDPEKFPPQMYNGLGKIITTGYLGTEDDDVTYNVDCGNIITNVRLSRKDVGRLTEPRTDYYSRCYLNYWGSKLTNRFNEEGKKYKVE